MRNIVLKGILIVSGTFFLVIGIIGIFIPLLPTTPFLLLAAACYIRGSKRLYKKLIDNKWFGEYIKNYQEKRGIPLLIKIFTIIILWVTIIFSVVIIVSQCLIQILLIIIAIGVTIHILTLKTLMKEHS